MRQVVFLEEMELPMLLKFPGPVSDEDLIAFSDRNRPMRFERNSLGEIIIMSPVGGNGSVHEALVCRALLNWAAGTSRGQAFISGIGFNLPDGSCLSPDASWVPAEKWQSLTPRQRDGFPPLCPDFLIEVRSSSDSRRKAEEKMAVWIANGAKLAWLVDPIAGTVDIYRPGEATETLERPDVVIGHAPVEGFVLDTTPLWADLQA